MAKTKHRPSPTVISTPVTASHTAMEHLVPAKPIAWIGLALIGLVIAVRLRLLGIPFERDEGVFAYIGKAFMDGGRLYTDLYDNKLPGLYLIYGLFGKVFGTLPFGIHLGNLFWQMATLTVFYWGLREIIGHAQALLCTGLFALYAASGQVLGFAAHATQLCGLPAFAGLWALWRATVQERPAIWWLFGAGLCAGLAIWIKQQSFFYAIFGGAFLIWWFFFNHRTNLVRGLGMAMVYGIGVFLPFGLTAGWFALQDRFSDFWFWTVNISNEGVFQEKGQSGAFFFNFYFPKVIAHWWWMWFVGVYGLIVLLRSKRPAEQKALALLLPLSFWGISLGKAFYPHYFVLLLPWLAFCTVAAIERLFQKYGTISWIFLALIVGWPVVAHSGYWFSDSHRSVLRKAYGNNPFEEMEQISAELKKRCSPSDSISIIGSEPELFLYTDRPSALHHLFFQAVVQRHSRYEAFQRQTMDELWAHPHRFVVLPGSQYEFLKNDPLVKTSVNRLQKEYHPICVVDMMDDKSVITWDPTPEQESPKTLFWILVLEKNP